MVGIIDGGIPVGWRGARGANVVDVDGNRYVDLTGGFGAALVGHRNPQVVAGIRQASGRLLHGLILKHKYTRALEIGTSTGHSGVWIAWALAKTGGRLTTVEVDPERCFGLFAFLDLKEDLARLLGRSLDVLRSSLRDAPLHQRTLRAAIDWSYQLLEPEDRRILRSLSVFAGGSGPVRGSISSQRWRWATPRPPT